MASYMGVPQVPAYSAAKCAVIGLTRSLAAEWSPHGVRVNAIAPGWIETPMTAKAFEMDPPRKDKVLSRTPMARVENDTTFWNGTPEQLADRLRPYVELGFRTVISEHPAPYDVESLERFIGEVVPLL